MRLKAIQAMSDVPIRGLQPVERSILSTVPIQLPNVVLAGRFTELATAHTHVGRGRPSLLGGSGDTAQLASEVAARYERHRLDSRWEWLFKLIARYRLMEAYTSSLDMDLVRFLRSKEGATAAFPSRSTASLPDLSTHPLPKKAIASPRRKADRGDRRSRHPQNRRFGEQLTTVQIRCAVLVTL